MNNFFKKSRFWTFEQIGSRQDQMNKYLGQVQSEMFKQSMHRNIVGTLMSLPIYYFSNPTVSTILLIGVGAVQLHSIYKHKQCTNVLGYYKDQKSLLQNEFQQHKINQNINNVDQLVNSINKSQDNNNIKKEFQAQENNTFANTSNEKFANYSKDLQQLNGGVQQQQVQQKQQQQSNQQSDHDNIRYIQIENTEERMKYYNRQIFCMGLLQGLFLGNHSVAWMDGYIFATSICFFINTFLNAKIFQNLYQSNYNMTTLKAMLIGTFPPLTLIILAPVMFNNGFIQSNLLKEGQKLFLSENINQDPSHFLMNRTGLRLFGLLLAYFTTLFIILGDPRFVKNVNNDKEEGNQKWLFSFNNNKKDQ